MPLFRLKKNKKKPLPYSWHFLYDRADWLKFKNSLNHNLKDIGTNDNDPTHLNDQITEAINSAAKEAIPKSKTNKGREKFPKYITDVLDQRNKWRKIYNHYVDDASAQEFKRYESEANNLIKDFQDKSWQNFVKSLGPSPLSTIPFWKRINRLRDAKRKRVIATIVHNNQILESNVDKANLFADNLESKFTTANNPKFCNDTFE